MRRAIILTHAPSEGPSLLAPALARHGFSLTERMGAVDPSDAAAELVVVMGGPMGVYEADQHPFLAAELAVLGERVRAGRPILGVCLGAQLLAAAAGARVFPGTNGIELGVAPVRMTPEARGDAVFAGLETLEVAHWHGDTFDAVPGATVLASTERYRQQAFRLGNSYGLQFHVELTPDQLVEWLEADPAYVGRAGKTLEDIVQKEVPRLRASGPVLANVIDRLAAHFERVCNQPQTGA